MDNNELRDAIEGTLEHTCCEDFETQATSILSLIDSQRCVWTLCEDDPTYGKTLQLECDKGKYHPYFLLRLDKYPFCPCCGRKIEVKDGR
jgi:hypothetical protein